VRPPALTSVRRPALALAAAACAAAAWVVAACARADAGDAPAAAAGAPAPDSLAALRAEVEYLRTVSAEKDTLLLQVRETQDFIDDIDAELARLAGGDGEIAVPTVAGETRDPQEELRSAIRARLRAVADRLARSEAEARRRAARARELASRSSLDSARLAGLDSTVARFEEIVRAHQERVAVLVERIDALERKNAELAAQRDVLADSVDRLVARVDSVFVRAGPRDELLRLGVVVEDGGKRLPFVGWVGRSIQPARTQTDGPFTLLDRRRDLAIPLPPGGRTYRIVSPHDPALLDPAQPGNPIVRAPLRVRDPERFWAQSRYLVLVEEPAPPPR